MAWTQADLDAIERAIANGTTEVQFGDRTIKYRSLTQLQRIRSQIMQEINAARPVRRKWPSFGKGIE